MVIEIVEKGIEEALKRNEVDVQSLDQKHFRPEPCLIPYDQIEMYQCHIHALDEKHRNAFMANYRWVGNDVRGGKPTVTIQPDD